MFTVGCQLGSCSRSSSWNGVEFGGTNWPSGRSGAVTDAVNLEKLEDDHRSLHAKLYEMVCQRGRIIVSGSFNATNAGLGAERNVEVCVVRIQREKSTGWRFTLACPPIPPDFLGGKFGGRAEYCGWLTLLLDGPPEANQPIRAAEIRQCVVSRLQLESTKVLGYLDRLVRAFTRSDIPADGESLAQAIMLIWAGHLYRTEEQKAMALRRQLLRVFRSIPGAPPSLGLSHGFQERVAASSSLEALWGKAKGLETIQEKFGVIGPMEAQTRSARRTRC